MGTIDLSSYLPLYLKTARENADQLALDLDKLSDNVNDKKLIQSVFMNIHSLKGKNLAVGYQQMGTVCRMLESLFYEAKEGKTVLSKEIVAQVLEIVSKVKQSLDAIERKENELDFSEDKKKLDELLR